jgi:peptidoglycan/LPS O-acetylase OafA/YrhL
MAVSAKTANRTYVFECLVTMALYIALLLARPWLLAQSDSAALETAIKILPALPVWAFAFVVFRHYRRIDEFQRLKFLENLAIAGGITALIAATYDFFQDIGAPKAELFLAWPIFAIAWSIVGLIAERRACA